MERMERDEGCKVCKSYSATVNNVKGLKNSFFEHKTWAFELRRICHKLFGAFRIYGRPRVRLRRQGRSWSTQGTTLTLEIRFPNCIPACSPFYTSHILLILIFLDLCTQSSNPNYFLDEVSCRYFGRKGAYVKMEVPRMQSQSRSSLSSRASR